MTISSKDKLSRINIFLGIVVLIFLILVFRVSYLQLIETEHYRTLARENTLRLITITAPRGEIMDRHQRMLVGNRPLYTLSIVNVGQSREELAPSISRIAEILESPEEDLWEKVDMQTHLRYEPIRLVSDVPLEVVARIEEEQVGERLSGVVVDIEPMRDYPYGETLAHVLGYIREIQPSQLERYQEQDYRMGDLFGQAGLENSMERMLRGIRGARQVEVDAYGQPVRNLGVQDPVPGNDLLLTVDLEVQQAMEAALAEAVDEAQRKGYSESQAASAVLLKVDTGEVIAMASYPAYEPGIFAGDVSREQVENLMHSSARPLLNRAIQNSYPPGSTFKMVVAAAALEAGSVDPNFQIFDPGYFSHEGRRWRCWHAPGHGQVDLVRGLQVSCNTFFWSLGLKVGPEKMAHFAQEFYLGKTTGVELPGEVSGVVPSPAYKEQLVQRRLDQLFNPRFEAIEEEYAQKLSVARTLEERENIQQERDQELRRLHEQYEVEAWDLIWRDYDTLNTTVGQGDNSFTALQLATYTAALANGGYVYRPYIVQRVSAPDGRIISEISPEVLHRVQLSTAHLRLIQEGMSRVNQTGGTAYGSFYDFPLSSAGKTGTAEVHGRDNHALFVGFAPFETPEVAISVIVEHGGQGSSAAAPVARKIMDAYFGFVEMEDDESEANN